DDDGDGTAEQAEGQDQVCDLPRRCHADVPSRPNPASCGQVGVGENGRTAASSGLETPSWRPAPRSQCPMRRLAGSTRSSGAVGGATPGAPGRRAGGPGGGGRRPAPPPRAPPGRRPGRRRGPAGRPSPRARPEPAGVTDPPPRFHPKPRANEPRPYLSPLLVL